MGYYLFWINLYISLSGFSPFGRGVRFESARTVVQIDCTICWKMIQRSKKRKYLIWSTCEKWLARYLPDFICGDLDSVRQDVLEYYKSRVIDWLLILKVSHSLECRRLSNRRPRLDGLWKVLSQVSRAISRERGKYICDITLLSSRL